MANYWKLFKRAKAFYFSLGKVKCPALGGEEIIFDQRGFRHFMLKNKGKRPIPDQIRRFELLFKIFHLIGNTKITDHRDESDGRRKTIFISLLCKDSNTTVKVVVLDDGSRKYFVSIMNY